MLTILLIGDSERCEFRQARALLERLATVVAMPCANAAAADLTARDMAVDLIVVAQSYPGEFTQADIERLRRLAPLARVLGLLGSWCEGEMRTGHPWPAVIRIYWHQWAPRCQQELSRLGQDACSAWALPATATEEERLLWGRGLDASTHQGVIAICTPHREQHDWLCAAFRYRGYATVWLRSPEAAEVMGAVAGVFDMDDHQARGIHALRQWCAMLHPTPVFVLASFPRMEDRRVLLAQGAAAVLSKPIALEDLFWQIERHSFT